MSGSFLDLIEHAGFHNADAQQEKEKSESAANDIGGLPMDVVGYDAGNHRAKHADGEQLNEPPRTPCILDCRPEHPQSQHVPEPMPELVMHEAIRQQLQIPDTDWQCFLEGNTRALVAGVVERIDYDGRTGGVTVQLGSDGQQP